MLAGAAQRGSFSVMLVPVSSLERKMDRDTAFASRFYKAIAVALADRLRVGAPQGGKGGGGEDDMDVPSHLLDTIAIAGTRFADLQRRSWGEGLA